MIGASRGLGLRRFRLVLRTRGIEPTAVKPRAKQAYTASAKHEPKPAVGPTPIQ
ncbi:hypothetical protein DEU29_10279 [Idiomarina aquatica]|uniref:Uncharacterized protein n=1 Tax=Idiomarina aquatica TaxID=1327752 RepID=A0A4R6PP77_9GAMM|nr:hypothetical protein DEU29_10279 [Idiomarina aquatica]